MTQTAKILLVDDEPGMLRYIKTLLEVDEYKVETATTGEEAPAKTGEGAATRSGCAQEHAHARHRRIGNPGAAPPEAAGPEGRHAVLRQRYAQSRAGDEAGERRTIPPTAKSRSLQSR